MLPLGLVFMALPIVLSKHFNHPHTYIEIATAISDAKVKVVELDSSILDVFFEAFCFKGSTFFN